LPPVERCTIRGRKQTLILMPEIALTGQFLDRFAERFGVRPAGWHSEAPTRCACSVRQTRRSRWCAAGTASPRAFDLSGYLREWLAAAAKPKGDVRLEVDIDPQSFL
jgi:primosomal protein N'